MNIILNTSEPDSTITINVNFKKGTNGLAESFSDRKTTEELETIVLETKSEDELNMDYSNCAGFQKDFMGFRTPLPDLEKQLMRQVARLTHQPDVFVLNYHHFSTIHHSVRRMPVVSAANIDGNPSKRKNEAERKDEWLRDNRIDFDVQLNDAFYKKSNFDKGHMTRREDANWGQTAAEAFRDAQLTCMYTNACPQVPLLNRAVYGYHGLWGQLEQNVLEQGVKNEIGESEKICVYNGPIFVSTDPVFKGIQVPIRFFKIIVWVNGAGERKTTAFILSQEDLVNDIEFEELKYDEDFKEHQCSVEYLERLTSLRFTEIRDLDTFVSDPSTGKGVKSLNSSSFEELIEKNTVKK